MPRRVHLHRAGLILNRSIACGSVVTRYRCPGVGFDQLTTVGQRFKDDEQVVPIQRRHPIRNPDQRVRSGTTDELDLLGIPDRERADGARQPTVTHTDGVGAARDRQLAGPAVRHRPDDRPVDHDVPLPVAVQEVVVPNYSKRPRHGSSPSPYRSHRVGAVRGETTPTLPTTISGRLWTPMTTVDTTTISTGAVAR